MPKLQSRILSGPVDSPVTELPQACQYRQTNTGFGVNVCFIHLFI